MGKSGGGCCCGGGGATCQICVNASVCFGSALSGATVKVSKSGTVLATCTTDGSGHCCVTVPTPGPFHVDVSKSGYSTFSQDGVACGSTVTALLSNTSAGCEFEIFGCGIDNAAAANNCVNATVTINGGSYSTTATSNIVLLTLPIGTYAWSVSAYGHTTATGTITVTSVCGVIFRLVTLTLDPGYVCPSAVQTDLPFPIPKTLFATTAAGTITLTYSSIPTPAGWFGCSTVSASNVITTCSPCALGTATIPYYIRVFWNGPASFEIDAYRYTVILNCGSGLKSYSDTATSPIGCPFTSATVGCGSSLTADSGGWSNICQHVVGSGTFTSALSPFNGAWSVSE